MSECLAYPLSELVDRYLMRRGLSKKKFYSRYLTLAEEVWQDLFTGTLWSVKSTWQTLKEGDPYNYVDVPRDCLRLLSVGVTDKCHNIQPLYYNNQLNVVSKPATKKCGCGCPDCGSNCEAVNSLTVTTKVMFTVNGKDYIQTCWQELCPNGDILEYCETPVKEYHSILGSPGDYNIDYNDDYLIGTQPFADYTIVTRKSQRKVCKLDLLPCGCPVESPENKDFLQQCCGCCFNWGTIAKRRHCHQYFENTNSNCLGQVKLSECSTKIYYRPSPHWKSVTDKEFPDFLLLNYQTDGTTVGSEVLVPKYARECMYAEIDYGAKVFNNSYSQSDKKSAEWKKEDERNKLIQFLNPLSFEFLENVQDSVTRW